MFKPTVFICLQFTACYWGLATGWLFSDSSSCYRRPNVGCFPTSSPFTNSMGFGPQSPQVVDVHFVYNTPRMRGIRFKLSRTRELMQTRFNPSLKTVVIIHGYMETPDRNWIIALIHELQRQDPMNIFVVDWVGGAFNLNYFQSVANTRMVGAVTALFLEELMHLGASPSSFHLIGFSLGAHTAGYAGSRVRGIGRITGLDPAGPGFKDTHPAVRLDHSDANLVDVVHTDTELGTRMPCGTIDFYPNGGSDQPSCGTSVMSRLSSFVARLSFTRASVTRALSCSHFRAPELYIASINSPCSYRLKRCQSVNRIKTNEGFLCQGSECPSFGYHLNSTQIQRFSLYRFPTGASFPYC